MRRKQVRSGPFERRSRRVMTLAAVCLQLLSGTDDRHEAPHTSKNLLSLAESQYFEKHGFVIWG